MSRRLLACLLAGWLGLAAAAPAASAPPPRAIKGELAVDTLLVEALPLQGEWGFAWEEFVDPAWQQLPTAAYAPVPSSWNDLGADRKPPGENGWGSYVLQVNCPAGESLAVEAVGQRTASRLFVNGTQVAAHGVPGPSTGTTHAAVHHRVPITAEFPCPLRITLHVANFAHRAGGFVRPIYAGPADVLARERESRVLRGAVLLSAYFFTGLVALIFVAVRRRERIPLAFGLFCLCMGVYTDMIGQRLLLRPLGGELDWVPYMRIEYLSWLGAMALFTVTVRGLFPQEIDRRVARGVVVALGLAGVGVLALPPGVYSYSALPGQFIAVAVCAYVVVAIFRAQRRTPTDARILLVGMLAVLVALAIDLLLIDAPRPDDKFAPIGFALFLLSPAVVIGRRLSHALNAEERNRTLEENARLREDVERMSRHDLKTPLNSILGATRLLRDDVRLAPEQQELVGVLQRAGFRMLEMVNLSLGLFRMETGSYDFRPQAVDLRDVATRVLVDLHSYAEAGSVTLYLQGSGSNPVFVRGEELLCYSIVANLVKNAVEAAGAGQRVTLALRGGDPVTLTVHNPGEVPPDIAGQFFEKYVTRGKSGGTGLGTYSARLMARAQQGELELQTGPAKGTTLTLTLPPLQDDALLALTAAAPEPPAAQWGEDMPARDVLLVDDDEFTRLVTRRFLPSPPFNVETAANGQAASEAMLRRWPHYLLLDMEMPVKSGVDTVRWVRAHETRHGIARCKVVMLSGNDDEASAQRALRAGADRFLVKPVSRDALLATLRELEVGLAQAEAASGTGAAPGAAADLGSSPADEIVVVDPEWMEVFPGFVRSQRDTVEAMARALASGDREDLQFLAHRATGGLGSMGLHWAARQSRIVEQDALHASSPELERRIVALRHHLGKVRIESA
ncbi:MAG: response regulator [Ramlibacter sp.]